MRGRTNILSGGGTAVANGELKEFVVADNKEVKVGDFVQVIYQENKNLNFVEDGSYEFFFQIDDTRAVCFYRIGEIGNNYRISICLFENNTFLMKGAIILPIQSITIYNVFLLKETNEYFYICIFGSKVIIVQISKDKSIYQLKYKIVDTDSYIPESQDKVLCAYKLSGEKVFKFTMYTEYNGTDYPIKNFGARMIELKINEEQEGFSVEKNEKEKLTAYQGGGTSIKRENCTDFILTKLSTDEIVVEGYMSLKYTTSSFVNVFESITVTNITDYDFNVTNKANYGEPGNLRLGVVIAVDPLRNIRAYSNSYDGDQRHYTLEEGEYSIKSFLFLDSEAYFNINRNVIISIERNEKLINFQALRYDDDAKNIFMSNVLSKDVGLSSKVKNKGIFKINDNSFALFYGAGYYVVTYKNNQLQSGQDMLVNMVEPFNGDYSAIGFSKTGGTAGQTVKVYVPWEVNVT